MFQKYQHGMARGEPVLPNRPLVLRPRDLADVCAAVRVASAAGLSLSVRLPDPPGPRDEGDFVLDLRNLSATEATYAQQQLIRERGQAR